MELEFEGGGAHPKTTMTGTTIGMDVTGSEKIWRTFQSIGDIAFAYNYSTVLIEIQACILLLISNLFALNFYNYKEDTLCIYAFIVYGKEFFCITSLIYMLMYTHVCHSVVC